MWSYYFCKEYFLTSNNSVSVRSFSFLLYSNFELKISLDGQIGVVFICLSVMLYSLFVTLILSNSLRITFVCIASQLYGYRAPGSDYTWSLS